MSEDPAIPGLLRDERSLQQTGASDLGLFGPVPQGGGGLDPLPVRAGEDYSTPGPAAARDDAPPIVFNVADVAPSSVGAALAASPPPGADMGVVLAAPTSAPMTPTPVAPAEPTPVAGGGSTLPGGAAPMQVALAPMSSVPPSEASTAAATPSADTVDAVRAGAEQLSTALGVLADQLKQSGGTASDDAIAAVSQAASALSGQAGAILGSATSSVEALTDHAADLLSDAQVVATDTLASVSMGAADLVAVTSELAGAVTASAGELAGDAAATVEATLQTADSLVTTVTDTLDLDGLGGVDPAGGMATLTALLDDAATSFEIRDAASDAPVFAPAVTAVSDLALADVDIGELSDLGGTVADSAGGLLGTTEKVGGLLGSLGLDDDAQDGHG